MLRDSSGGCGCPKRQSSRLFKINRNGFRLLASAIRKATDFYFDHGEKDGVPYPASCGVLMNGLYMLKNRQSLTVFSWIAQIEKTPFINSNK